MCELIDTGDIFLTAIGNPHGDIYEQMYDFAVNSKLNKSEVPPYYEKYMKPLIQGNGDGGVFKLW